MRVWEINGLLIKVTIHRTNIVSVVVGCSLAPITLDVNGLIRLTNALSIVEDRLSRIVEGSCVDKDPMLTGGGVNRSGNWQRHACTVPAHTQWTVTMWHFGADSSVEYSGEKFNVAWETAENVLIRAYSKIMGDSRTRIRLERQEYPRANLADAIEQKINANQRSRGWVDNTG